MKWTFRRAIQRVCYTALEKQMQRLSFLQHKILTILRSSYYFNEVN